MDLSHQPHRPTPPCSRGLDADSPRWTERGDDEHLVGSVCTFRRSSPLVLGLIENPLAIMLSVDPQM